MNNEKTISKQLTKTEFIILSFNVGNQTITENIEVKTYIRKFLKYGTSSTGKTGWWRTSEKCIETDFGGYSTGIYEEINKDILLNQFAQFKHNCFYNGHLDKYFRKLAI